MPTLFLGRAGNRAITFELDYRESDRLVTAVRCINQRGQVLGGRVLSDEEQVTDDEWVPGETARNLPGRVRKPLVEMEVPHVEETYDDDGNLIDRQESTSIVLVSPYRIETSFPRVA